MKFVESNFDKIYVDYYQRMFRFAKEYVISNEDAENIVHDIFLMLWEKRKVLKVQKNLSNYLFTLVKNKCLDHLRHINVADQFKQEFKAKLNSLELLNEIIPPDDNIEELITIAINKLPERCRLIFIKNRFEDKKYHEIANEMGISANTVENQMAIALKKLRIELKDYLPILFFII